MHLLQGHANCICNHLSEDRMDSLTNFGSSMVKNDSLDFGPAMQLNRCPGMFRCAKGETNILVRTGKANASFDI